VIVWDIDENEKVTRKAEALSGFISAVALTQYEPSSWHTFVREASGKLKAIGWRIDQDDKILRRGDALAGAITEIAADGPVTAARGGNGNLELIWWNTNDDDPQRIQSEPQEVKQAQSFATAAAEKNKIRINRYSTAGGT
jgi:hypothetical protein